MAYRLFIVPRDTLPAADGCPQKEAGGGAFRSGGAQQQPAGQALRNLREVFGEGPVWEWALPRRGHPRGSLAARTLALQKGR